MKALVTILYTLSSALLIPVIVLLLAMFLMCLLQLGGFVREAIDRRRSGRRWREVFDAATTSESFDADAFFSDCNYPGILGDFANRLKSASRSERTLTKLVADQELAASRRLARMSFGIRVGPILGLMGTLIPLGPALVGLSDGNLTAMSEDLVVAFTTTVLGMSIGGISYAMWLVRRQWYASDLVNIEYLADAL
ncbi:MotA/TolQ/ExbB proton channel family protein [Planctomycetes bacterium TBK1r]|uniref:MotA/TolQ/ExbB proton channel family protein n=1 Tax=Stieleria magnilauensis TaxID=2527963 RepID=A0ABX5XUQ9_9BACT|nr:MotA/TolQ/ExbB proton channel family protein [Planctomycetes bacterium TBK1r]